MKKHKIEMYKKLDEAFTIDLIQNIGQKKQAVILADENTYNICVERLYTITSALKSIPVITIPSGENNKNWEHGSNIITKLLQIKANRNTVLINIGGGMITDIGGFVASIYKRGIPFINIPTSLMAMTDAAIGGKTAIDFNNLKNMIGTFSYPEKVLINTAFLDTLKKRELLSGFAEIIKHFIIFDKEAFLKIQDKNIADIDNWAELIKKSVEIKKCFVLADPKEKNIRKALNFGHTFGHGIESLSLNENIDITHGEAVAAGIICESFISLKRELIKQNDFTKIFYVITQNYEKIKIEKKHFPVILSYMLNDKKNEKQKINATLIKGIGRCLINQELKRKEIEEALNFYIKSQ